MEGYEHDAIPLVRRQKPWEKDRDWLFPLCLTQTPMAFPRMKRHDGLDTEKILVEFRVQLKWGVWPIRWREKVIRLLCGPLVIPRAKQAIWLNIDLIRLLAEYL